jgi:sterol desaturase/sphingolipid hydroxylase (fatty acid hydroxylase superfamily)
MPFQISDGVFVAILSAAIFLGMICATRIIEKKWPIADTPASELRDDWVAVAISLGLRSLLAPIAALSAAAIVGLTGFGWLELPTGGLWWCASLALVVVVLDLYKYAIHRLQHAVPVLWSMHSFHHSANAVTFITGARHFWLERVLVDALLPVLAVLFRLPPAMAIIAGVISFIPEACAHLNVRISLGRFVTWINNPQFHRIHHSNLIEHRDKNFASVFPIWDILFGTVWVPEKSEYPPTGITPPERAGIVNSVIWPVRHFRRR